VGEWLPAFLAMADGTLYYSTWTQQTASRWQVQDFASSADWFCDQDAQYTVEFFNTCGEIHFTALNENCALRTSLLKNVYPQDTTVGNDCTASGTEITTNLAKSVDYPRLAGDKTSIVFGLNGYAVVSVDTRAAIFQRWRISSTVVDTVELVDLASYPESYACSAVQVGVYTASFDANCASRLCFSDDACRSRSELFHDIGLNDFAGDMCSHNIADEIAAPHCGTTTKQWNRHYKDCLAQDVPGGCMYCSGIALGEKTEWCLDRQSAGCDDIFNSVARQTFCNLEFECPAASISASIAIFICSLLALFLR